MRGRWGNRLRQTAQLDWRDDMLKRSPLGRFNDGPHGLDVFGERGPRLISKPSLRYLHERIEIREDLVRHSGRAEADSAQQREQARSDGGNLSLLRLNKFGREANRCQKFRQFDIVHGGTRA